VLLAPLSVDTKSETPVQQCCALLREKEHKSCHRMPSSGDAGRAAEAITPTPGRAQVARLAMVSQAAVFRDIVPGYRVRLPTDKELAMPVSKDVRRLRDHEAALLRAYQARPPLWQCRHGGRDGLM